MECFLCHLVKNHWILQYGCYLYFQHYFQNYYIYQHYLHNFHHIEYRNVVARGPEDSSLDDHNSHGGSCKEVVGACWDPDCNNEFHHKYSSQGFVKLNYSTAYVPDLPDKHNRVDCTLPLCTHTPLVATERLQNRQKHSPFAFHPHCQGLKVHYQMVHWTYCLYANLCPSILEFTPMIFYIKSLKFSKIFFFSNVYSGGFIFKI